MSPPSSKSGPDNGQYQKQRWNVYTTMLMLSLFAILIAIVCLWLDFEAYHRDVHAKGAGSITLRCDESVPARVLVAKQIPGACSAPAVG